MSVCIVYHSATGNTRAVAERLASLVGGDLVRRAESGMVALER